MGAQSSAEPFFTAQCRPAHAWAAVLNHKDKTLLRKLSFPAATNDSRHTLLYRADKWETIEASTS